MRGLQAFPVTTMRFQRIGVGKTSIRRIVSVPLMDGQARPVTSITSRSVRGDSSTSTMHYITASQVAGQTFQHGRTLASASTASGIHQLASSAKPRNKRRINLGPVVSCHVQQGAARCRLPCDRFDASVRQPAEQRIQRAGRVIGDCAGRAHARTAAQPRADQSGRLRHVHQQR